MYTDYVKDRNDPRIPVLKEDLKAATDLATQMGLTPVAVILHAIQGTMMLGPDSIMGLSAVVAEYSKKELDRLDALILKGRDGV